MVGFVLLGLRSFVVVQQIEPAGPVALYFAHYNFCSVHGSLTMTPATAGGLTDRVWTIEEFPNAA
jgi:hypothetical protein